MTSLQTERLSVLLVAGDDDHYTTASDMLADATETLSGIGTARFLVERCARYRQALAAIRERRHDVYLIDSLIGVRTGLELVSEAFAGRPWAPVILLTPHPELEPSLEAAALGVTEQLVKPELSPAALRRAIRYAVDHHRAIAELMRSEERYSLAIRATNDGIWDWDLAADRIHFSPRWLAILGRADSDHGTEQDPSAWFDCVHPGDILRLRGEVQAHLDGRTPHLLSEYRMQHADGTYRWVLTRGLAIRGPDGVATRMAGSLSDVTDRQVAQLRLQHDAMHDNLTGLPNRSLFIDRVQQYRLRTTRDPAAGCAVLFFDLDRFKLVNDSLSHAVGDKLLVAVAGRVATALRPADTVARLSGDEFAVLLEDVVDAGEAEIVAERILRSLDLPFDIDGHELFASVSIGIALSERDSGPTQPSDLIANADIAMYTAKRRGRGRSALFDEGMRRRVVDRMARESELRRVVEASLMGIHYQPIVDLNTGEIRELEALARWPEGRESVAPAEFISIAEETGIIGALGRHVLGGALETLAGWRRDGLIGDEVCVSVNLSGRQLDDPALAEQVRTAVESAHVPARALKLEITESTLVAEIERAEHVFADVCASGIGLHLDDFGTGYSSLAALHRFPVDALKVDRSFVAAMTGSPGASDVIVRSTIAMAHSLGLPVIAEGIEDAGQLRRLRSLGCDLGQGHLFSPPLSAVDTRALLDGWRSARVTALGEAAPA